MWNSLIFVFFVSDPLISLHSANENLSHLHMSFFSINLLVFTSLTFPTMKKSLVITAFVLLAGLMFTSCGSSSSKEKQTTPMEVAKVEYTCPMHSEVVSEKPGDCPKCCMPLVEKK